MTEEQFDIVVLKCRQCGITELTFDLIMQHFGLPYRMFPENHIMKAHIKAKKRQKKSKNRHERYQRRRGGKV